MAGFAWLKTWSDAQGNNVQSLYAFQEILESQFEKNPNFRTLVSAQTGTELRSQPLGKDKLGNAYWCTLDDQCNLRIYQEHLDEEIWKVVATNREEMVKLIACLRGNELVLPSLVSIIDEDSSSNSMPPKVDALQPENGDGAASNGTENGATPTIPNLKIKLSANGNGGESSAQIANGSKANGAVHADETDEDDDEDASAMSEVDEMSAAASESSATTAGTKSTVRVDSRIGMQCFRSFSRSTANRLIICVHIAGNPRVEAVLADGIEASVEQIEAACVGK